MKRFVPITLLLWVGLLGTAGLREPRTGVSSSWPGGAAGAADTLRLSLSVCIDRALALGEEMQQAEADRSTAHARYLQARSTALPAAQPDDELHAAGREHLRRDRRRDGAV